MKKVKLFLLLLLLGYISNTSPRLNDGENQVIEFEIGSTVEYDINKNYFKFDYSGPVGKTVYFSFLIISVDFYLTDPNGNKTRLYYYGNAESWYTFEAGLNYTGTYYINIGCQLIDCIIGRNFTSFIPGRDMEIIDFSKNIYYSKIAFRTKTINSMTIYKVAYLYEDK